MKQLLFGVFALITLTLNAQSMQTPTQAVIDLFVATDERQWTTVEKIFDTEVLLDYSTMSGAPAATLTPKQITDSWKALLPGFTYTHHQLGNFQVETTGKTATVKCYGTATHYLEDEAGSLWTVVGTYVLNLRQDETNTWRISTMKFNYKYQTGNSQLPQTAMEVLK